MSTLVGGDGGNVVEVSVRRWLGRLSKSSSSSSNNRPMFLVDVGEVDRGDGGSEPKRSSSSIGEVSCEVCVWMGMVVSMDCDEVVVVVMVGGW